MWPLLVLVAQLQIPQPVGYVNDFAQVIGPDAAERMRGIIEEVRAKSGGEIVVVTLGDLGGRPPEEVAVRIGREWGVGARGAAGDRARNTGVVLLLKPGERPGDGRSDIFIATGLGSEGFITDARAGRIRDEIGRAAVQAGQFDEGLVTGVQLLAAAYAQEFGFELTGVPVPQRRSAPRGGAADSDLVLIVMIVIVVIVLSQMRRGGPGGPYYRRRRRHGLWIGGMGGSGGGFGGGGFGGGGAGGRF